MSYDNELVEAALLSHAVVLVHESRSRKLAGPSNADHRARLRSDAGRLYELVREMKQRHDDEMEATS